MQVVKRRIQIGSDLIYYQVAGFGRPVVLIHGLSGSTRWWKRNIGALAQHFQVYVIDLINFGGSRSLRPFVLHQAADDLRRWMDKLQLRRASLVGHSMGGFIAADMAARFPNRVDRLVLVDAAILPFDHSHLRHAIDLIHTVRRLPPSFLPVLLGDAFRAGPITIVKAARELLTTDLRPELHLIQTPTCIIWGARDRTTPVELGRQMSDHIPDAAFIVIEKAGHNPMWDQADRFNEIVVGFLQDDEEPAGR